MILLILQNEKGNTKTKSFHTLKDNCAVATKNNEFGF